MWKLLAKLFGLVCLVVAYVVLSTSGDMVLGIGSGLVGLASLAV